MRKTIILIFPLVFLIAVACGSPINGSGGTTPLPETKIPSFSETEAIPFPESKREMDTVQIGKISLESDMVEHGLLGGTLEQLAGTDPLFDGDSLRLYQGGESILDFGDSIKLRLFNDTELNEIRRTSAEGTPFGVQIYLALGGFTGRVTEEGSQATVRTPGETTIRVLGTDFFVTYDVASEQTTIGNFNGTVEVNSGGVDIAVDEGFFVVVPANEPPGPPQLLTIDFDQFEERARELNSPLVATQGVGDWLLSLAFSHELTLGESDVLWHDTKGYSKMAYPPENSQVTWSGNFVVKGEEVSGEGKGEIDGKLICPLMAGDANLLFEFYEIHGTFTFNIGGTLTYIQDKPVLYITLEGDNFSITTTANQINHKNAKNCQGNPPFYDYYENLVLNTNDIVGMIELEARDGASQTFTDIESPGEDRVAQLEVVVNQAPGDP